MFEFFFVAIFEPITNKRITKSGTLQFVQQIPRKMYDSIEVSDKKSATYA